MDAITITAISAPLVTVVLALIAAFSRGRGCPPSTESPSK